MKVCTSPLCESGCYYICMFPLFYALVFSLIHVRQKKNIAACKKKTLIICILRRVYVHELYNHFNCH